MRGTIGQGHAAGATVVAHAGRQELPRVAGPLLAVVAVLYVATPVLQAAVTPFVESDLGLTAGHRAAAQVVGLSLAIAVLAAAGRAGDVWGRRSVLAGSLVGQSGGGLLLAVAFSPWVYVLGRVTVAGALAALFVSCPAFLASASMPGRIRRVMGGWLAAMSVGFVLAVALLPRAARLAGWRPLMALLGVAALAALVLVRRCLPATRPDAEAMHDPVRTVLRVGCAVTLAAALQLAPLWGWRDVRIGVLLVVAVLACAAARLRRLARTPGGTGRRPWPVRSGARRWSPDSLSVSRRPCSRWRSRRSRRRRAPPPRAARWCSPRSARVARRGVSWSVTGTCRRWPGLRSACRSRRSGFPCCTSSSTAVATRWPVGWRPWR
ncbi:MFS transporter [Streptomyces sp. LMG1-1-1.1]|uniref:MFS transporter n=1 Tax=Streptomyces sp. LMG1-1-1.1 TaxID=3135245 RepID=UPI0034654B1E